jgi:hypothetical protein
MKKHYFSIFVWAQLVCTICYNHFSKVLIISNFEKIFQKMKNYFKFRKIFS